MTSGRILSVPARVPGPAGRFPWGRIETLTDDGRSLAVNYSAGPGSVERSFEQVNSPSPASFDLCPICLSPDADTVEHVPGRILGGGAMTRTCAACNNGFGAFIEPHLTAWVTESFEKTRFESHAMRGHRFVRNLSVRWTDDGDFVLLVPEAVDRGVETALRQGGEFSLTFPKVDMDRVRLAALKHAYLAACLQLGEIARGRTADVIRGVLTLVRDISARQLIPENVASFVKSWVHLERTYLPPSNRPVAIMARQPVPAYGAVDSWICLAGVLMVRWPLPEHMLVVGD